jgi:deoxyribonuclease-4
MMHLNDSKSELGSRLDRHEHVGAGRIGERGMAHLLRHPLLAHVATYVETPGMDEGYDAINVRRAQDLAAGRPLEPLPPGAFNLRGSRSRGAPERAAEPA